MAKTKKTKKKNTRPHTRMIAAVLLALPLFGFLYWYFSLTSPKLPEPPLRDLAAAHGVKLGVLTYEHRLGSRVYPDIIKSQFEFVTIDGGAHLSDIRPTPTTTDYTKSDKIIAFAEANNMSVQLHHLLWGDKVVLPSWLTEGNYSKKELRALQQKHITELVTRYKGRVREYTVINEPFTEAQHVYGLRSWWQDQLGNDPKLMDDYFRWAHQADPDAKLIINDFYNETKTSVSDALYDYVKAAKARGVPIHGVGIQMHVDAARPHDKQTVIENMRRFGKLGAPVYITEFDVNTNAVKGSDAYKTQLESQITYDMTRACIESKACASFTVFGVTSKNDLVKKITKANSRAYLFDSRYRPRASFYEFRRAWLEP